MRAMLSVTTTDEVPEDPLHLEEDVELSFWVHFVVAILLNMLVRAFCIYFSTFW